MAANERTARDGRTPGGGPSGATPTPTPTPTPGEDPAFEAKVRRTFIRDGRLVSIPAQDRKRQVILRWLVGRCFDDDRDYPEREVNMCLALVHPDVAALRRYLVDAKLMTRRAGQYRPVPARPSGAEPPE